MLESHINTTDLTNEEPVLADYYRSGQTTWGTVISQAQRKLEVLIKNRGLNLKWLCQRLSLTDATKSDEDEIERTRLVIIATAVTPTPTAVLQGTNDITSESWTTVTTYQNGTETAISFTAAATKVYEFNVTFKYYKLTWTGTITATQYLVERSFELPHLYLSIAMAFKQLQSEGDDNYSDKAEHYLELFESSFDNALYSYDYDQDGKAEVSELKINRVMFTR